MLPGEAAAVWAILLETLGTEVIEGQAPTEPVIWIERIGEVRVPKGTQRSTVLRMVLDHAPGAPEIPLEAGQEGTLHAVSAQEMAEGVPIKARATVVFDRVTP